MSTADLPNPLRIPSGSKRLLFVFAGGASVFTLLWISARAAFSSNYLPHLYCYLAQPKLVWTHVTADMLIGASYVAISATLGYLVYRLGSRIPFHWMFIAFGSFIVACGATHFMEVVTIWKPYYWVSAEVKIMTAIASVLTAVVLPTTIPRMVSLVEAASKSQQRRLHLENIQRLLESQIESQSQDVEQLAAETADRNRALANANDALRASESRLTAIIGSAMDAIITVDSDQRVIVFNRAAEQTFGISAKEAVGQPLDRFIPGRFRENHRQHVEAFASTGTTSRSMYRPGVLFGLGSDGTEFPIEATISQVETAGRKLFTVILRDMTERRATEAKLLRQEKLASAGRMAATIAHEINNPLESVTNLFYLLAKNPSLDERARHQVALADEEVKRVGHIAKQTLGFYRDGAGPAPMRVSVVLDEVLRLYARKLESTNIAVERDYCSRDEICAVEGELRQVFSNLIVNAVDAMPTGGRLVIRTRWSKNNYERQQQGIRIAVADTGCGIAERQLRHVFEPFYTTKKDVGTGLGLWLSKSVVEKHGGSVRVRSGKGAGRSGTIFLVCLPETMPEAVPNPGAQ
jgi:PAS domain S-box-containing protein